MGELERDDADDEIELRVDAEPIIDIDSALEPGDACSCVSAESRRSRSGGDSDEDMDTADDTEDGESSEFELGTGRCCSETGEPRDDERMCRPWCAAPDEPATPPPPPLLLPEEDGGRKLRSVGETGTVNSACALSSGLIDSDAVRLAGDPGGELVGLNCPLQLPLPPLVLALLLGCALSLGGVNMTDSSVHCCGAPTLKVLPFPLLSESAAAEGSNPAGMLLMRA